MNKLVVLSLGNGDLYNGFPVVTAQLWESNNTYLGKITGSLPAAPEISELYNIGSCFIRLLPTVEFMSSHRN